ncbi:MAG: helix-turn-helix domain-containing protein [Nanoarchaeota archaeon]|nr:helix-turn-helix domain-containing protein [Nanoarchaeota archaeon]MBU1245961.1 helix-turn-helix domain-containing protein [Nanoarchaeota archaeon]MBU1445357.1 helix-turn-helix domain-containing protein [Nanoarchaeota archaeon]MBU2443698.1 helix-turn-helix domain-containing protein [Nanoarchaeota archaeon]
MNVETLEKMGLSSNEARVYLALLELGPSSAGKITEKSKVNRRTVYDVLESLIDKGLVSYIIEANRKIFEATDPTRFLDLLKEKEKEIRDSLPELIAKKESSKKTQEATLYRGKKGIKTIFEDILGYKNYDVFGSHGRFGESLGPYFDLFQKRVKEKKINCRLLVSERLRETKSIRHAKTKFLKKEYDSPVSTIIYGDKVATIIWTDEPVGFVIKGKEASSSFRNYFEIMWEIAKE